MIDDISIRNHTHHVSLDLSASRHRLPYIVWRVIVSLPFLVSQLVSLVNTCWSFPVVACRP